MDRLRKGARSVNFGNSFSEVRSYVMELANAPADSSIALTSNEEALSVAAAMMMQASCRRLLVRARRARLTQAREVKRRNRRRSALLSTETFSIAGDQQLKELQRHSVQAIDSSVEKMPAAQRPIALKGVGCDAHRLLWAIEGLTRIAAAPTEGAACDEMGLLLCEVLNGTQCEVYPVEVTEGGGGVGSEASVNFLRLNHRMYVPAKSHGLFGHDKCDYASGRPISFADFVDKENPAEALSVLEWYEARTGYREMVVKSSEQDKVQATMRERNFRTTRLPHRLAEFGHAMAIPVFAQPNRPKPRPGGGEEPGDAPPPRPPPPSITALTSQPTPKKGRASKEGKKGRASRESRSSSAIDDPATYSMDVELTHDPTLGEPQLMALIQLTRPSSEAPFDKNDEYIAHALAPHLGHALRRAYLLERAQDQRRQLAKLHAWAGGSSPIESIDDVCKLASSIFSSDDVALYALLPDDASLGGGRGPPPSGGGGGGGSRVGSRSSSPEPTRRRPPGPRGSALESEVGAAAQSFVRNRSPSTLHAGGLKGGVPPPPLGRLQPVVRGHSTPVDSVAGLEVLCASGQSLAISQAANGAKGFDTLLSLLRRPTAASARSMLCVPAYLHRQTLGLDPLPDTAPGAALAGSNVVPVLLQWTNAHGRPFSRADLLVASALTDVLGRIAAQQAMRSSQLALEDRFKASDARRGALMESARMLAARLGLDELCSGVMLHAKDLVEADRATLFMVDQQRQCLYTLPADGSEPITTPWGAGIAGACSLTAKPINVPDAWRDDRFNRDADAKAGYRSRSLLCHPIKNSKDQVIAVIQLINKRGTDGKADGTSRFSALDEELIAAFGAQLAVSIENVLAINEMSKAGSAFKQQQRRMQSFLDVCGELVRAPLPAHEICERTRTAAMECTDSTGAALFVCADHAPDVLSVTRVDLDAIDEALNTDGSAGDGSGEGADGSSAPAGAASFAFAAKKKADADEDPELNQIVPDPLTVGCWPSVTTFCMSTLKTKMTLEDAVDLNDNGLPEVLRQYVEANIVRCLATPLSTIEGDERALGVLVVWGADDYTPADHHVLQTLARLAAHLIVSTDRQQAAGQALDSREETVRALTSQRDALVSFARQLGVASPEALHGVARSIAEPLLCADVTLWLVETNAATGDQVLVTQLPPGASRVGDEDEDEEGGDGAAEDAGGGDGGGADAEANQPSGGGKRGGGSGVSGPIIKVLNDGTQSISVPIADGRGVLGHAFTTAKALRVHDAHIHSAYAPEVDEAVHRLQPKEAALCVVPLRDHNGRVLGLLHASGKHRPVPRSGEAQPALWERDPLDTPRFSSSDFSFLTLVADRMASQLQQLNASGKASTEVADGQQAIANMHEEAEKLAQQILEKRQLMHSIHHPHRPRSSRRGGGSAASGLLAGGLGAGGAAAVSSGGLGGLAGAGWSGSDDMLHLPRGATPPSRTGSAASSSLSFGDAHHRAARLPALDARNAPSNLSSAASASSALSAAPASAIPSRVHHAGAGGLLARGKRGTTASQPNLLPGARASRGTGRQDGGVITVPQPGGGMTILSTPEAVFDDLCRTLREL